MALPASIARAVSLLSEHSLKPETVSDLAAIEAEAPGTLEAAALALYDRQRAIETLTTAIPATHRSS